MCNFTPSPHTITFTRTAIFEKDGMYGSIHLAITPTVNAVTCVDPREPQPRRKSFETPSQATHWFNEYVIATTTDNAWKLIYNGSRNTG